MKKIIAVIIAVMLLLTCAAFAEEDGQNPVMNIIGSYQDKTSERASLFIEAGEGNTAKITVSWANSAFETVEWTLIGEFDAENNTINYENAIKAVIKDEETATEYENGTGKFIVNEDWTIVWQDDIEDAGNGCVFAFIDAEAEEDGQNPVMNLVGSYQDETSQRASLFIEAAEGNSAVITVSWANGAEETVEWKIFGEYDPEAGTVSYENAVKSVIRGEETETVYENGTGKFIVNEDWTIAWLDDIEDAGNGCVFTFVTAED